MLATALTLALFGFAALMLAGMVRADSRKILAAFAGRSWASQNAASIRPVAVRFNPRYPECRPMRVRPELRAAA